jgi:hypothetical protein
MTRRKDPYCTSRSLLGWVRELKKEILGRRISVNRGLVGAPGRRGLECWQHGWEVAGTHEALYTDPSFSLGAWGQSLPSGPWFPHW